MQTNSELFLSMASTKRFLQRRLTSKTEVAQTYFPSTSSYNFQHASNFLPCSCETSQRVLCVALRKGSASLSAMCRSPSAANLCMSRGSGKTHAWMDVFRTHSSDLGQGISLCRAQTWYKVVPPCYKLTCSLDNMCYKWG